MQRPGKEVFENMIPHFKDRQQFVVGLQHAHVLEVVDDDHPVDAPLVVSREQREVVRAFALAN